MTTPHIVIIGASIAGVTVATNLEKLLGASARITVIEPKDHLFNTIGSVRALVDNSVTPKLYIPLTKLFKNADNKVVQAAVTQVHNKHVVTSAGETVAFDYLVIASGSRIPAPAKSEFPSKEEGIKQYNDIQKAISSASSVAIVGGGAVGIEWAGEIATDFPNIKVTLIHSGEHLLSGSPATAKFRAAGLAALQALKVNVLLNEKVQPTESGSLLPSGKAYHLGPHTLKTVSGKEVASDVQLVATGSTGPNSDFVKSLGEGVLDDQGFVRVTPTGQLLKHQHIFSLGDVSDLDHYKVAFVIMMTQAPLVAGNIASVIKAGASGTPSLKSYKQSPTTGAIGLVSTGRNGGFAQLPFGVFGNWTSKMLKSGTLNLDKPWALVNAADLFPK